MMGHQITSPVPPPSTVYGLLAAAAGREVPPDETWIGYRLEYDAIAEDLEKIIVFGEKGPIWDSQLFAPKTNVLRRQFLFNPRLTLYMTPGDAATALRRPRFPLLLGRSQDVAYVASHDRVTLDAVDRAQVAGCLLPFPTRDIHLRSRIMSLPTFFPLGTGRRALSVKPFHILDAALGPQEVFAPGLLYRETTEGQDSMMAVPVYDVRRLSPG
jgi:CRISPR-associated protein Cas5t